MARRMIVGRQMIVGNRDYQELMGYGRRRVGADGDPSCLPACPPPQAGPYGQPVAYSGNSGPQIVEEDPTHTREFPIGFASTAPVPANQTPGIEVKPQVLFRGERLAVPNSIVLNFGITDIKVGKDSQLAAPGEMPSECFSNISVGVRMQLDTAEPGITITVFAHNTDQNNAHPFSSALYGTVIE